jgi:hypothetical protein
MAMYMFANVDRLGAVSSFFDQSKSIDFHNQLRRNCLGLEKCWVAQDWWCCLHTTITDSNVKYALRLCQHHGLVQQGSYTISEFSGELLHQLIGKAKRLHCPGQPRKLQKTLQFPSPSTDEAETPPPRVLQLATPSPIEAQEAINDIHLA